MKGAVIITNPGYGDAAALSPLDFTRLKLLDIWGGKRQPRRRTDKNAAFHLLCSCTTPPQ